jgi:outer membrane protein assembly factor BamB
MLRGIENVQRIWRKNMFNLNLRKSIDGRSGVSVAVVAVLVFLMLSSVFVVFNFPVAQVKAKSTTTVPADMLQYEWPMTGADNAKSYSSAGPAPSAYNILWKTSIHGISVSGSPMAFNGMVFVQGSGRTYGLDPYTGNVVWNVSGTGTLMKLDDTYMLRGTTCVRISDGSTVWTAPAGFNPEYYAADIKMFVSPNIGWNAPDLSQPPTLAWNTTDQQKYGIGWFAGIPQFGLPYVNGTIFQGTQDGFVMAIDAKIGETRWVTPSTAAFFYGGTYADGKVIFGGLDNNMYAWDAETGELAWTYNPGTWYGQWSSGMASAYGLVFEHNQDTYLYAINATTGELVWRAKGPGIGYSGFCEVGGGIVFSTMGEAQYRDFETGEYAVSEYNAYNATTGKLLWSAPIETGAGPFPHECIAYGNLYIVPTTVSPSVPGVWSYAGQTSEGAGALNELWCISSQAADWPMQMSSADNSAEGGGPSGNLALKWSFKADGPIVSSTTLVDGVGYFASETGTIYAVDANTGAEKWSYSICFPMKSTPVVANGKVYTGADDGNVYALDASTGTKVWQTPAGGITIAAVPAIGAITASADIRSSPKIYGNVLYVGALDGNFYALDPSSGLVLWKYQTGGPILATPCITSDGIYVPASTPGANGTFYKLNLNGQLIWKDSIPYFSSGGWMDAAPTVAPDLGLVFLRRDYRLTYGINATTGDILWTYDARINSGTPGQANGVMEVNSPLYTYGKIFMNDFYGIVCLDATTGNETWYSYLSRENLAQSLAYSYNRIYTVNELGVLYVLDATTGQKISYYEFGNTQLHSAPSLYGGCLYLGAQNWHVYCLGDAKIMNAQDATSPSVSLTPAPTPAPVLTADDIAQKVISELPAYPNSPTADEIAQKVVAGLPGSISADEVAQKVLANLPTNPTADQIAQEINSQLSVNTALAPEFNTANIVIIVAVVAALAIGIVNLYLVRKRS